jgi:hypothetical protein
MSILRAYLIGPAASPSGGSASVVLVEPNGDESFVNCHLKGQTMEIGFLNGQVPEYYHDRYGGPNMVSSVIRRAALGISRRETEPSAGLGPFSRADFLQLRMTEAFEFARKTFGGRVVPTSGTPYLGRAMAVSSLAIEYGADEDEAIAALLKDAPLMAPEPAPIYDEIHRLFGERVHRLVHEVNRETVPGSWAAPNVVSADSSGLLVLMADRLQSFTLLIEGIHAVRADTREAVEEGSETIQGHGRVLIEAVRRHAECTPSIRLMTDRLERSLQDLQNL